MALTDVLRSATVDPISGEDLRVDFQILTPGEVSTPGTPRAADQPAPPASCLMVTTGERFTIRWSLECYRRQIYENREMVIVTYLDRVQAVRDIVAAAGVANVNVHGVGRELTLGEMRNVSVARARGEILIQWDDDDLYDPARISAAVMLLTRSAAAAALLLRVLIWWPERQLAAISAQRLWEGSIALWRAHAPVYSSLERREDTHALAFLTSTRATVVCDAPMLYVYVAHGDNISGNDHFENHLRKAGFVLGGSDYDELMEMLSRRMPIHDYRAEATRTLTKS